MEEQGQADIFSTANQIDLMRLLLADLHDELPQKLARLRHLEDLSSRLGAGGTMMPGGEVVLAAWTEARTSFIHGNYVATVLLCQSLAENMLAAYLELGLGGEELPERVAFSHVLRRCLERNIISEVDEADFKRLMNLRNPLSHYKSIRDPANLSRRVMMSGEPADDHLRADASFAIAMAVQLLSMAPFKLSGETILDRA